MSVISNEDFERIVDRTTREIFEGMSCSLPSNVTSAHSKNQMDHHFNSSVPEVSDTESTPAVTSTLQNPVEVIRWCLAICQLGGDCCIVGHFYYEGSWILYRTSYIRSVHENGCLIYDDDGNWFRIVGSLTPSTFEEYVQNENAAIPLTFHSEMVAAFKNGLPSNYRMWVQRIAYEAQNRLSSARSDNLNQLNASRSGDVDSWGVRKGRAEADKAASMLSSSPQHASSSKPQHVTRVSAVVNNDINVDLDAESSEEEEEEESGAGSESSDSEDKGRSCEDLPSDGESCESHVSKLLCGNPFKTFFYDKMLERTQTVVALRKKRDRRNQRKYFLEKEGRNQRISSLNDEKRKILETPSSGEKKRSLEALSPFEERRGNQIKSIFAKGNRQNQRLSFPDEKRKNRETPSSDEERSLLMISSGEEQSNNEKVLSERASLSSSFREPWSVVNRASSLETRADTKFCAEVKLELPDYSRIRPCSVIMCDRIQSVEAKPKKNVSRSSSVEAEAPDRRFVSGKRRRSQSFGRKRKRSRVERTAGSGVSGSCDLVDPPRSAKRRKLCHNKPRHSSPRAKKKILKRSAISKKKRGAIDLGSTESVGRRWGNVSFFGASTVLNSEDSACVLHTLSGHEVDVRQLTRTRSGRLSRPPLDDWRGQRIATDALGNIKEVHHGKEDRFYSLLHLNSSSRRKSAPHELPSSRAEAARQKYCPLSHKIR